jgi:hypothetical protein
MYNRFTLLGSALLNVNVNVNVYVRLVLYDAKCHLNTDLLIRVDPIPNLLFCGGRLPRHWRRRKRELTPEP